MLLKKQWLRAFAQYTGNYTANKYPCHISQGLQRTIASPAVCYCSATPDQPRRRNRSQTGRPKDGRDVGVQVVEPALVGPERANEPDSSAEAQPHAPPTARPTSDQAAAAADATAHPTLAELLPLPAKGEPQFNDCPFKLRSYQVEAIQTVLQEWKEGGVNAQMVMLPTGCGKTICFAALARYMAQYYIPPPAQQSAASQAASSDSQVSGVASGTVSSSAAHGDATVAAASMDSSSSSSSSHAPPEDVEDADADADSSADEGETFNRLELIKAAIRAASAAATTVPPRSSSTTTGSNVGSDSSAASTADDISMEQPTTSSRPARKASDKQAASSSTSSSKKGKAGRGKGKDSGTSLSASSSEDASELDSGSKRSKGRKQREPEVVAPPGSMRVLVLAHRHELLHQAEEKFRLMWGAEDLTVSWVKGQRKEFGGQVVVASVATAVNCVPALKACNFSLIIVDEAHHTVAASYKTVLEGLGLIEDLTPTPTPTPRAEVAGGKQQGEHSSDWADSSSSNSGGSKLDRNVLLETFGSMDDEDLSFEGSDSSSTSSRHGSFGSVNNKGSQQHKPLVRVLPNPDQLLLGFSATPYRLKVKESRHLYDIFNITYTRSIADMIRAGHLSEVHSQKILTQTDLKGAVVGANGDFISSKLSALVNSRTRNKLVLAAYLEHCTAEAADTYTGPSAEQQEQHERLAKMRAAAVMSALESKARRDAEIKEKKRLEDEEEEELQRLQQQQQQGQQRQDDKGFGQAPQSDAGSSSSSSSLLWGSLDEEEQGGGITLLADGDQDEDEDEEEEATEVYPLPATVSPASLTGGLSMAGRQPVRKTIAFAVDIKHAEAMNAVFNAAGVRSSAIHSRMPHDIMKGELVRFRRGELDVLFNVEVLTEGFDEPSIDAILMARPTRSQGLYTQMLGRGLRIMPGKADCMVLDFTDRYHQAGKVIDVRVLLPEPEPISRAGAEEPEGKGPSRIEEGAQGGDMDLLERALDAKDLAWRNLAEHCMTSIFSGGNVWLVQVGQMGPTQRQLLGLAPPAQQQQSAGQKQRRKQRQASAGDGGDDSDDGEDDLQDRYVVLHQTDNTDPDPFGWKVAYKPSGHSWRGLSKEDAFGAALDYIDLFVRQQQVKAVRQAFSVRASRLQQGAKRFYPHLNSFKQDAGWRRAPATDKQLQKLKKMEVVVTQRLTKGEASDLISASQSALASWELRQQLKEHLDAALLADLPVPLLKAYATKLLEVEQQEETKGRVVAG